jgi:Ulp1 family protease
MSYLIGKDSLTDERYIDKISKNVPADFEAKICQNYETVKKWTRKVGDLFKKEFILIPVNMPGHWSLIMVVRPHALLEKGKRKAFIIFMDSMGEKNTSIMEAVRM